MTKLSKLLFAVLALICPASGWAQGGVPASPIQFTSSSGRPLAGATVTVCTSAGTGFPCTPLASIFTDAGLTISSPNPVTTDGNGNLPVIFATPGVYKLSVTGSGITSTLVTATVAGTGGGNVILNANNPFTGNNTHSGTEAFTGPTSVTQGSGTFTGDTLFKSGRPWYDVMAFGAKNDNSTDDTAAIQAAITAACATSYKGGIIYFPPGAGYKTANTSISPYTVSCSNLHFMGVQWGQVNLPQPPSQIIGASLTAPMFVFSGNQYSTSFENLALIGNPASATATAIAVTGTLAYGSIYHNFFEQWGGPAITTAAASGGWWIRENWAQNCLMQRPAAVDTGCFDLSSNDTILRDNFVTTSVPTAAGNIGTGHTYAYAIRGSNAPAISGNMAEISQHGWLVTGNLNTFSDNRSFLIQGNGMTVNGNQNTITNHRCLDVSQTANGSFDCFVFTSTESLGGNILSDSQCEIDGSSNGNNVRHCITDNNSAGTAEFNINRYVNNRYRTNLATGVFLNRTGGAPVAVTQAHTISLDRGDASVTIQAGLDQETQFYNTALTANRTVTPSGTGAWPGARFRIARTTSATGAFTLTVASTPNVSVYLGQSVDIEFQNGQWNPVSSPVCCTTTNNNAVAGSMGEFVNSVIATGSSVALTTAVTANVTSISLTAGDWDVSGAVDFTFGATTSYTNLIGSISTTSATIGAQDSKFDFETPAAVPTAAADATFPLPVVRLSLGATTTVFLVAQGTFTVSTLKAYGTIQARRVR